MLIIWHRTEPVQHRSFVFHIYSGIQTAATSFVRWLSFSNLLLTHCANNCSGSTTDIAIWSVVELGIGIIVISLPSLGPLFRNIPFFAAVASGGHGVPVSNQTISTSSWRGWRDRKMSEAHPNALDPPTRRNSETSGQDLDIYFSDRGLASQ